MLQAIVDAFVKSPDFQEVKMYLCYQNLRQLRYEHVDKILISIEERLNDEDCTDSYLLNNLNPIKTACHILMLLDLI